MDTISLMGVPLWTALSNAPRGCTCVRSATRRITAWSTAEPTDFQLDVLVAVRMWFHDFFMQAGLSA